MPAPTPFIPIDLDKPGIKKKPGRAKAVVPFEKSFAIFDPDAAPPRRKYNKDELKLDVAYLSQRLTDYLKQGNRFELLMAQSKIKDLAVVMGILTEKLLLLEGQPTQIISNQQHQKMDEAMAKIIEEAKRRGLTVTASERKIEVNTTAL